MCIRDRDISVPVKGHDEFSVLAQNINGMTEQLRHSFAKQKEMEENKAELITNVAHDLRTPLTSIIGYLQLINDEKEITQETTKKYASIAYNKSLKLQRLIAVSYTHLIAGIITFLDGFLTYSFKGSSCLSDNSQRERE